MYNLVDNYIPAARLQSPDVISHLLRHGMRDDVECEKCGLWKVEKWNVWSLEEGDGWECVQLGG